MRAAPLLLLVAVAAAAAVAATATATATAAASSSGEQGHSAGRWRLDYYRHRHRHEKAERDKATLRALYNITLFPHSMALAAGAPLPDIFAPTFKIRLFPVGEYSDAQGALEYFVLAAPNPAADLAPQIRVSRVHFDELHASGDGLVTLSVVLTLTRPAVPSVAINHTHFGFCHLDADSRICGCKLTFQRLELNEPPLPETREGVIAARLQPICEEILAAGEQVPSLAAEDRYPNATACVAFLLEPARYRGGLGMSYGYVDQDSPRCREWHMNLVRQALARAANAAAAGDTGRAAYFQERARQHLTHSGPRGGGKCVDHPFASFVFEDFRCT